MNAAPSQEGASAIAQSASVRAIGPGTEIGDGFVAAAVANGGDVMEPHLVKKVVSPGGSTVGCTSSRAMNPQCDASVSPNPPSTRPEARSGT